MEPRRVTVTVHGTNGGDVVVRYAEDGEVFVSLCDADGDGEVSVSAEELRQACRYALGEYVPQLSGEA